MNGAKIYFSIGGINITSTAVSSCIVMIAVCIAGYILGRNPKKRPDKKQVVAEKLVTMIYNLVEEAMGKHNSHWTPYIGALFISSLGGSLIGMTGFLKSTTCDLSTTLVWALMTSFLVWGNNIKHNGLVGFLKGYINPLNIISDIAQPVAMAFRHFGNIRGGGVLISLLYSALATGSALVLGLISKNGAVVSIVVMLLGAGVMAVGFKKSKMIFKLLGAALALIGLFSLFEAIGFLTGVPILALGIPGVLSLYFDVFSGLVQALVFSLLTMVYVGMACPPPEETSDNNA